MHGADKISRHQDLDQASDVMWKIARGLDLGNRPVFEVEVLLWRICVAKSLPPATIDRVLNEKLDYD